VCPEWKPQQKILWAEVLKESGRRKSRWRIRNLLTDERCSQSVLDFLSTMDVGRLVPAEEDAGSEVSEWERREQEEERRVEAEALGAVEELGTGQRPLFLPTPSFMASVGEEKGAGHEFLCSFFCSDSSPL